PLNRNCTTTGIRRCLWASSPLPLSSEAKERGKIPGGPLTQGSSFLATAGLICETHFGVFKMAGLQSCHPYGISVWRDFAASGGAEKVEGIVINVSFAA